MLACARPVGYKLLQSQGFLYKVAKKTSNPLKNQNLIVLVNCFINNMFLICVDENTQQ